jgi:hypothetical protein
MATVIDSAGLGEEVLTRRRAGATLQALAAWVSDRAGRSISHVTVRNYLQSVAARTTTLTRYSSRRIEGEAPREYLRRHLEFIDALFAMGTDPNVSDAARVRALAAGVEAIPEGFELVAESLEIAETETIERGK